MKKTIKIDGKPIEFESNAGTPILFKRAFDADLFALLTDYQKKNEEAKAIDTIERLAYIMNVQAQGGTMKELLDKVNEENFYEWLCQFDSYAFINAMKDIVELWLGQNITLSESKN